MDAGGVGARSLNIELQAAGFDTVYKTERRSGPIIEAACWAHARRKFFELADIASKARGKTTAVISPIAFLTSRNMWRSSGVNMKSNAP